MINFLSFGIILFVLYNFKHSNFLFYSVKNITMNKSTTVEIKWVDLDIQTFGSVQCDKYEEIFKGQYKLITRRDKKFISELNIYLKTISKMPPINHHVDTRYKILIKENDTLKVKICGNRFFININGITYKIPLEYIKWLNKNINNSWGNIEQ